MDRQTVATKACVRQTNRESSPTRQTWIESTATADRAVRRCVVSSSTNAAAPTDTVNVASSNNMCADQTSIQPRSIPALPIISCIVCVPLRACLLLVLSTGTRFDPNQSCHSPFCRLLRQRFPSARTSDRPHWCNPLPQAILSWPTIVRAGFFRSPSVGPRVEMADAGVRDRVPYQPDRCGRTPPGQRQSAPGSCHRTGERTHQRCGKVAWERSSTVAGLRPPTYR